MANNKLNIAISNIAWEEHEDRDIYNLLKRNNIRGLEIAPRRLFNDPYNCSESAIKEKISEINVYDIDLVAMQSIHYGYEGLALFGSIEERVLLEKYTKKAIEFAEKAGIQKIVFGSPKIRNGCNTSSDYHIAVEFFKKIAEYASQHNLIMCIEPNPKIYNTNFINTIEEAFELVQKVNSKGLRLHIDIGEMIANNEAASIIRKTYKYIEHIHISEPYLTPINKKNVDLHREIFSLLKELGYSKWISIEMRKQMDGSSVQVVEAVISYLKSLNG